MTSGVGVAVVGVVVVESLPNRRWRCQWREDRRLVEGGVVGWGWRVVTMKVVMTRGEAMQ